MNALQDGEDVSNKLEAGLEALLVDPQTCGPLLVSCTGESAQILADQGWSAIGQA